YLRKLAVGVVVGIALAAPIIVAFVDYVSSAYLGRHGAGFDTVALPRPSAAALFFPYVFGPIFGYTAQDPTGLLRVFWGNVGGYLTTTLLLLDVIALYSRRLRSLRILLVAWIILSLGRIYDVGPLHRLFDLLPVMNQVAAYRYLPPSLALAAVVLAAIGIDDLRRKSVPRWFTLAALAAGVLVALALLDAGRGLIDELGSTGAGRFASVSVAWGFGIMVLVAVVALVLRGRLRTGAIVALVVVDALAMFVGPEFSAPRSASVDARLVAAVRSQTGLGRFYTLGPFTPNFGSDFGIGEVDVNDLPMPKRYTTYITSRLDTNVLPNIFIGDTKLRSTGPDPLQELVEHFTAYERLDVRAIVALPGTIPAATSRSLGLRLVYSDTKADVYATPHPSSYYSVLPRRSGSSGSSGCRLTHESLEGVVADCRHPAVLVRRELSMTGWTATVGSSRAPVRTRDDLFQEVSLPGGRSVVAFSFTPPHERGALAALLVALAAIAASWVLLLGPVRRWRDRMRGHWARRRPTRPSTGEALGPEHVPEPLDAR
ncbi:MAG: hypothetical protein ACRDXC_11035, partial [Acidimicrobiales bacterium]